MNPIAHGEPPNPHYEECLRLHRCWAWFLILGILLMLVGMVAMGSTFIATLASVMVFGFLLLAGGTVQVVNAFLARTWRGFFVHLLAGTLQLIVGMLMLERPEEVATGLTLLLAAAFLAGGSIRIVITLLDRFPGWPWVLLNGVVTLLLGILIWRQWPESSMWVIGLFVGIDLLFSGWSWVMLGLLVRAAGPAVPPPGDSGHIAAAQH
jgi:uncharacterized membrane protein HdeD (DUF308 family)